MTPPGPQRSDIQHPRERPAPAGRPASTSYPRSVQTTSPVTAYDEIWFQGRPQLP